MAVSSDGFAAIDGARSSAGASSARSGCGARSDYSEIRARARKHGRGRGNQSEGGVPRDPRCRRWPRPASRATCSATSPWSTRTAQGLRALGTLVAEAVRRASRGSPVRSSSCSKRGGGAADETPAQHVVGARCARDAARRRARRGTYEDPSARRPQRRPVHRTCAKHRRGLAGQFRARSPRAEPVLVHWRARRSRARARGAAHVTQASTPPRASTRGASAATSARNGCGGEERSAFHTGDASRFLARAIKDAERYDLVIIDPPDVLARERWRRLGPRSRLTS